MTFHGDFKDTLVGRIYFDPLDGALGKNHPLRSMKPSEDLRKIRLLGYDAKPGIAQNPGQLFEKLRAGKER